MAGLSSNPNNNVDVTVGNGNTTNGFSSQLGGGVLLTISFGGIPVDGCERLVSLQEQRSRLALAASLLEQGLITQEQFQQLGASIARKLGITGPGPSGGPSARPVYVAPPALNTGAAGANRAAGQGGTAPQQRFPPLNTGAGSGSGMPAAGADRRQPGPGMPATGARPSG